MEQKYNLLKVPLKAIILLCRFYAIRTVQIQHRLRLSVSQQVSEQVWLADDTTGAGSLDSLKKWWDGIIDQGSRFGYYVNQKKSWIILKDENLFQNTTAIFNDSGINVTTEGKRHL